MMLIKEEAGTFIPNIHNKSKRIIREEAIDVILYKDAIRR
jgi:hypothetical protein